jgi:uncharacterized Tic20 family protein
LPPNTAAPPGQIIEVSPLRPTAEERNWASAAHLGTLVLWVIAPLVVLLTKGQESAFVREQAIESLNFQLTVLLASFGAAALTMLAIGFLLLPAVMTGALVLIVWASVRAYRGDPFRYPLNIRLIP